MRNVPLSFVSEEAISHIARRKATEPSQIQPNGSGFKTAFRRVVSALDSVFDCDGPAFIARFERVMRGTRSPAR